MPKKSWLFAAALALCATAAGAADEEPYVEESYGGWYIRADVGGALSDADGDLNTEDAFALGAGLGVEFSESFRADITYDGTFDYNFGTVLGDNVDAHSVLGNLYFEFPVGLVVQPYVGGGLGWGTVDGGQFDDDGVAVAAMAGLTYELPSNGALDVGWKMRYIDIDTPAASYWIDHSIRIGVRYGF